MADNYANPLAEAETDISKATKAITGLLDPKQEVNSCDRVKSIVHFQCYLQI